MSILEGWGRVSSVPPICPNKLDGVIAGVTPFSILAILGCIVSLHGLIHICSKESSHIKMFFKITYFIGVLSFWLICIIYPIILYLCYDYRNNIFNPDYKNIIFLQYIMMIIWLIPFFCISINKKMRIYYTFNSTIFKYSLCYSCFIRLFIIIISILVFGGISLFFYSYFDNSNTEYQSIGIITAVIGGFLHIIYNVIITIMYIIRILKWITSLSSIHLDSYKKDEPSLLGVYSIGKCEHLDSKQYTLIKTSSKMISLTLIYECFMFIVIIITCILGISLWDNKGINMESSIIIIIALNFFGFALFGNIFFMYLHYSFSDIMYKHMKCCFKLDVYIAKKIAKLLTVNEVQK